MDLNLKTIKDKLITMQIAFDPEENAYSTLQGIINKIEDPKYNTINLYQDLSQMDDKTEMPQFLRDYLYIIMARVKILSSQDKEISKEIEKQEKQIENIILDLMARGIFVDKLNKEEFKNLESYQDRIEYLEDLKKQNADLETTHEAIPKEKKLGEKLEKGFAASEQKQEPLKKVNEEAAQNIKEIVNPSVDQVLSVMEDYRKKQKSNSELDIKIEKPSNDPTKRILEVGFKGTQVDERNPLYRFVFTNAKEFDEDIIYRIAGVKPVEDKIEKALKEEKKPDEELSKVAVELEEKPEEMKKTNQNDNVTEMTNPTIEQVLVVMDYYRTHQNNEATSNIKIERPSDTSAIRIVEVGYKGTEVSEKEPKYRFVFTDAKEFDNDIVYRIIDGYHEAGPIEKTIEDSDNNELDIVGEDESRIEIENMDEATTKEIKDYADSRGKTKNKNQGMGARKREMEGNSNIILLTISFLLLVLSAVLIIMIFTKS